MEKEKSYMSELEMVVQGKPNHAIKECTGEGKAVDKRCNRKCDMLVWLFGEEM